MRVRILSELPVALALLVALAPARALASPTDEQRTLAEALFREGRRLMDEGHYAQACPKLAESQLLDPGGGTLLNLALCHQAEGRLATAWSELREALAVARRDGRKDREELALSRIAEVEPRLSRLLIDVSTPDLPGLEVRRGGSVLPRAAWGTAVPLDPGTHVVLVTAPGRAPFRAEIVVDGEPRILSVDVPELELATPRRRGPTQDGTRLRNAAPSHASMPDTTQRTAGVVLTFVGVAAGVAGAIAGGIAIERKLASDDACVGGCTQEGVDANEQAAAAAIAADVGLAGGLLVSGVGVALWLTAPREGPMPAPVVPGAGLRILLPL